MKYTAPSNSSFIFNKERITLQPKDYPTCKKMLTMISIGYKKKIKKYMPAMLKLSICVLLSGAGDRIGQKARWENCRDGTAKHAGKDIKIKSIQLQTCIL